MISFCQQRQILFFEILLGKITYGGANVVIPDITNVQGVIHVVDAVLLTDEDYPAEKKYSY